MKTKTKSRHTQKHSSHPAPKARATVRSEVKSRAPSAARLERQDIIEDDEQEPATLPLGMQPTREVKAEDIEKEPDDDTFSPKATGSAPRDQDEQGNRQSDEAAELEGLEPDLEDRYRSPR
jgi:hypothetical protein